MKHIRVAVLPCTLIIVVVALFLRTGVTRAAQASGCGGWSVVSTPKTGSNFNYLNGVAALSANDVWAVGGHRTRLGTYLTLIEQWDGTSWSIVSSPNVGSGENALMGVATASASDIWTVGYFINSNGTQQTLIEQRDGTSWSVVPSPNVGSGDNALRAVAVTFSNNAWAVGYSAISAGFEQALI